MNDAPNEFWESHSLTFLEMAFRTDRQERLSHADGHGGKTGDCGDSVEFFVLLEGERIKSLAYTLNGCIHTNACANAIIELIEGETIEKAWELQPQDVADYLGTLPEDHFHCAELAIGALYLTLSNASEIKRSPWKKMYKT